MSDDDYHIPSRPPGPPLAGFDAEEFRMSFRSADRRERTDPYGLQQAARPAWIDPTPPPARCQPARPRVIAAGPSVPGVPDLRPPAPRSSVWTWVGSGMALGMLVMLAMIAWVTLGGDSEGLEPLPASVGEVTR